MTVPNCPASMDEWCPGFVLVFLLSFSHVFFILFHIKTNSNFKEGLGSFLKISFNDDYVLHVYVLLHIKKG